jgi:hypothetical protein
LSAERLFSSAEFTITDSELNAIAAAMPVPEKRVAKISSPLPVGNHGCLPPR